MVQGCIEALLLNPSAFAQGPVHTGQGWGTMNTPIPYPLHGSASGYKVLLDGQEQFDYYLC